MSSPAASTGSGRLRKGGAPRNRASGGDRRAPSHLHMSTLEAAFSEVFTDLNAKFIETVNGHHPRRWVALFSVTGRAGGRDEDMEPPRQSRQRKLLDRGSVVWEQGTWTGNINVPDPKERKGHRGNFLLVAEKVGAALRIRAHTWSVNSPT